MTDRLITRKKLAAMLDTTPGVAASIMAQYGIFAVDFGRGRSRGARWLESAVQQVIVEMHAKAQPRKKAPAKRPVARPGSSLAEMSVDDLFNLTTGQRVQ